MFLLCLFSFFFNKILKCTCLCSVLVTKFSYKHVSKISQPIYALLQRNLGVGNEVFLIHVWKISGPIYPLSQVLFFISSYLENFGCWWRSFLYVFPPNSWVLLIKFLTHLSISSMERKIYVLCDYYLYKIRELSIFSVTIIFLGIFIKSKNN